MTALVHGEYRGLTWYEVPVAAARYDVRHVPDWATCITVIAPLGEFLWPSVESMLLKTPEKTNFVSWHIPFVPFAKDEMPGRVVMYNRHAFNEQNINEWARNNLTIPEEIDLTFEYNAYKNTMHVSATTGRNGGIVKVRKKLDTEVPLQEALDRHIPYFLRNCQRPVEGMAEFTCSPHVAAIVANLSKAGADQLSAWIQRHRTEDPSKIQALALPKQVVNDETINGIVLTKDTQSNIVRSEIKIVDGHRIKDDATGAEVTLKTILPDTVRSTLRGRSLGDVLGADWARSLKIRTVREPDVASNSFTMRVHGDAVPLIIPEPREWTDEEAIAIIHDGGQGEWARWQEVQASAVPILRSLNLQQLATVITMISVQDRFDLGQFGHEGWQLRRRGAEIIVETCPAIKYDAFIEHILEGRD